MIKRINDDRLSGVNGGSQSDPACICSIVCSCNLDKLDAKTLAKWPKIAARNDRKSTF